MYAVVMAVMSCKTRLLQRLHARKLSIAGGGLELAGQLVELVRARRISMNGGVFGGRLQLRGDLADDLLEHGRIRLLNFLEHAQELRGRRDVGRVTLRL